MKLNRKPKRCSPVDIIEIEEECPGGKSKMSYSFNNDPCASRKSSLPYMHKLEGSFTLDKIFPLIHHPSSSSKVEIYMTLSDPGWPQPKRKGKYKEIFPEGTGVNETCDEVYLTRTGSRSNQPNKCIAVARVPPDHKSLVHHSHRVGFSAKLTNQYQNDYSRDFSRDEELVLMPPLLEDLERLIAEFKTKLGDPLQIDVNLNAMKRRAAVIMVANEGVMDLLLNFICSANSAKMDVSTFIVFVGRPEYIALVENMGANAIYSASLGHMPKHAANGYLDKTFSRMMWFKMVSVYIAIAAGFDVLFQDVDLIWLKDPIPYLQNAPGDVSFMDDGARTPRYTPLFVNSGFYFLKNNPKVRHFQEKLMKSAASEIGYTHSHQSVMIRHLSEAHHLYGLEILVLDLELFPSGVMYHHNKKYMAKIKAKEFTPFVFHMCWTENRVDKVKYFKILEMWFIPDSDSCSSSAHMLQDIQKNSNTKNSIADNCCSTNNSWSNVARLHASKSEADNLVSLVGKGRSDAIGVT